MSTAIQTGAARVARRAKDIWSDLDYAQRRLFEIKTGVPIEKPRPPRRSGATVEELESVYRLSPAEEVDPLPW